MAAIVQCMKENISPIGDLEKLSRNPMFGALQATLVKDCSKHAMPFSLLEKSTNDYDSEPGLDPAIVAVQEANLLSDFQQVSGLNNVKVTELQNFYNSQCAYIESKRSNEIARLKDLDMLSVSQYQKELSKIHLVHDRQRMHLTNRVTASLQLLKISLPKVYMDVGSKTKARQLNSRAVAIMTDWFEKHIDSPYPTDDEKLMMAEQGGINLSQVKAWFANKRNRTSNTKPKKQKVQVEKKLLNICTELTSESSRTAPKMYGDIIKQLSDIVNSSQVFNPQFRRDTYSSSGDEGLSD